MQRMLAIAVTGLALALAGCGSGGIPANAVVNVGGTPITKTAFKHWMTVAATSSASGTTEKPAVPEPPDYTTCIARMAKRVANLVTGESTSRSRLKSECDTQYKSLQTEVLGFLISSDWTLGEAAALGVKLSDAEIKKEFTKIKSEQFRKPSEFQKFLSRTGYTVSDLLFRVKLNLLSQKIQKQIVKEKSTVTQAQINKYYEENKSKYATPQKRGKPGPQQPLSKVQATIEKQLISTAEQHALGEFTKHVKTKWQAKTECRFGYAVADCRGYKAPNTTALAKSLH
jgi:foldase protein PrsA